MDLVAHGAPALAHRFLDGWLQATGDHEGLPALRFHLVRRALVRAQVAALRRDQGATEPSACGFVDYLVVADQLSRGADPRLAITHGLPGSGKSFVSQRLVEATGAVRARSDVERKRLFGLGALESSAARVAGGIYHRSTTVRTYDRLLETARLGLAAGWPVIVDAAFLRRTERASFAALAAAMQAPFSIIDCVAPLPACIGGSPGGSPSARMRRRPTAPCSSGSPSSPSRLTTMSVRGPSSSMRAWRSTSSRWPGSGWAQRRPPPQEGTGHSDQGGGACASSTQRSVDSVSGQGVRSNGSAQPAQERLERCLAEGRRERPDETDRDARTAEAGQHAQTVSAEDAERQQADRQRGSMLPNGIGKKRISASTLLIVPMTRTAGAFTSGCRRGRSSGCRAVSPAAMRRIAGPIVALDNERSPIPRGTQGGVPSASWTVMNSSGVPRIADVPGASATRSELRTTASAQSVHAARMPPAVRRQTPDRNPDRRPAPAASVRPGGFRSRGCRSMTIAPARQRRCT
jgi:predicted kinase